MEFVKLLNFNIQYYCVLYQVLSTVVAVVYRGEYPQAADNNLLHYEPVYYDTQQLSSQHLNKQHSSRDHPIILTFNAFKRHFNLHLHPDRSSLTSDITLVHKKISTKADLSFIYSGIDKGHPGSAVTGAIINGTFHGTIKLSRDVIYHVVPSSSVFTEVTAFPSVVYLETDYKKNNTLFDHDHSGTDFIDIPTAPIFEKTRRRRGTRHNRAIVYDTNESLENKVCTLKLTTDQTVWRHVMKKNNQSEQRSLHEITFILTNHLRELNTVFRETKFTIHKDKDMEMDVQGIEFEIKKIVVMTEDDCPKGSNSNNPICIENINGENVLHNFADAEYVSNNDDYDDYDGDYGDYGDNGDYGGDGDYNTSDYNGGYENHVLTDEVSDKIKEGFEAYLNQVDYCLSFLFTARVLYSNNGNPLLGLTYAPKEGMGGAGICNDGNNNGFVTFFMSTDRYLLPSPMTQLVFTHEVAHAFGALHDNGAECRAYNLKQEPEDGFYLMHSIAQNGKKVNNRMFSPCSLDRMGIVLSQRQHVLCFKRGTVSVCGNGIVEKDEECDCGTKCHLDNCCYGKGHNKTHPELECTLKPKAQCSPSQGPCCGSDTCGYVSKSDNVTCQNQQPCLDTLYCDGSTYGASCPPPKPFQVRPDNSVCNTVGRLKVCNAGSCSASICTLIGWSECQLTNDNDKLTIQEKEELCYVGCKETRDTECISTNDDHQIQSNPGLQDLLNNVSAQVGFGKRAIQFPIGTPCNRMTGYCDVFMRCRGVDPDTPLVRIRQCFETGECFMILHEFALKYWWLIALGTVAGILLVCACIKCCAVHTKSNNPHLELKHPRRSVRQSVNSVRHSANYVGNSVRHSFSNFRTSVIRRPNNNEINEIDAKHEQELLKLTCTKPPLDTSEDQHV